MYYRRNHRDGIRVRIVETGEVFKSISECAGYLEVAHSRISRVVNEDEGYCTCRGYHIVRDDRPDRIKERRTRTGLGVMIVETGETFKSVRECSRYLDCSHKYILQALNDGHYYRDYHFIYIT